MVVFILLMMVVGILLYINTVIIYEEHLERAHYEELTRLKRAQIRLNMHTTKIIDNHLV